MSFFGSKYVDFEQFHKSRHEVRAWVALMPIYVPEISVLHDGDTGNGHSPIFYDIVKAGPNRIAFVGQPLLLSADGSYTRGGELATGHQWRIYHPDTSGDPWINHYAIGSDELVFGPANGAQVEWTPEGDAVVYRIECRTSNRASDGSTDARRWVRVFTDEYDTDLKEVISLTGRGNIESGGYEMQVTIKTQGGIQNLNDWSTVVVMLRTYYDGVEYTMDSQGPDRAPEIQFSGLIATNSVTFDRQSETLTFTMRTPDWALARIALRGYPNTVEQTIGDPPQTITVPVDYPLFFGDPTKTIAIPGGTGINVVDYIRQSDIALPVHTISGMSFSDPTYHMLQRHTNFTAWWDVELWQETEQANFPFSFNMTSVWQQLKDFQDKRLGVVYCDKKGALWIIPDVLFQSDVWFGTYDPANQLTFHSGNLKRVEFERQPFRVSQVKLTGISDDNIPYFSRWPDIPLVQGDVVQRSGMLAPSQDTLDVWAFRMFTMHQHTETQMTLYPFGINRSVELSDLVRLTIADHTGFYIY